MQNGILNDTKNLKWSKMELNNTERFKMMIQKIQKDSEWFVKLQFYLMNHCLMHSNHSFVRKRLVTKHTIVDDFRMMCHSGFYNFLVHLNHFFDKFVHFVFLLFFVFFDFCHRNFTFGFSNFLVHLNHFLDNTVHPVHFGFGSNFGPFVNDFDMVSQKPEILVLFVTYFASPRLFQFCNFNFC